MKECNHEKVCEQCTKEEIAKLQSQIDELKKKLPNQNCCGQTYIYPNLISPTPPFYYCSASTGNPITCQ